MAKIKFGALATDARGKIGGVVYSKNQYGGYIREKVSPVQPNSARQTLVRERLSTLAKRFSTVITQDQRTAWNSFGKLNPTVDVFGSPQPQSGISTFTRLGAVLLNVGSAIVDSPPASLALRGLLSASALATVESRIEAVTAAAIVANVMTLTVASNTIEAGDQVALSAFTGDWLFLNSTVHKVASVTGTTIVINIIRADLATATTGTATATDTIRLTFTDTPLVTPLRLYVHGTSGLAAGRQFFKANSRWFSASAAAQASPYNCSADYLQRFGALILGTAIGFTIATANGANGAASPGVFSRTVVTT